MKLLVALAALITAAVVVSPSLARSPAPAPTPSIIPATGALLGVVPTPRDGRTSEGETEYLEAEIGRTFDVVRNFHRWGQQIVTKDERDAIAGGRIAWINLAANAPDGSCSWRRIANGSQDAYIDQQAASVAALGVPVIMVFHHEPENDLAWCGQARDYRKAFARIHDRFVSHGATNAVFLMDYMAWTFDPRSGRNPADWYPGDTKVDWVVANVFNKFPDTKWNEMSVSLAPFVAWMRRYHPSKPLGVGASGTTEDPADADRKANWFRNTLDYFKANPDLKLWVYYSSPCCDYPWWFDTSPTSLAGFGEVAADPWFNQRETAP